jgi:hypothetical protein
MKDIQKVAIVLVSMKCDNVELPLGTDYSLRRCYKTGAEILTLYHLSEVPELARGHSYNVRITLKTVDNTERVEEYNGFKPIADGRVFRRDQPPAYFFLELERAK